MQKEHRLVIVCKDSQFEKPKLRKSEFNVMILFMFSCAFWCFGSICVYFIQGRYLNCNIMASFRMRETIKSIAKSILAFGDIMHVISACLLDAQVIVTAVRSYI